MADEKQLIAHACPVCFTQHKCSGVCPACKYDGGGDQGLNITGKPRGDGTPDEYKAFLIEEDRKHPFKEEFLKNFVYHLNND